MHPIDAIRLLTDAGSFREFEETIPYCSVDQLSFPQYGEALARGIEKTGLQSGLITGLAAIGGHPAVVAVNNFGLVGSSLCDEIGEKFRFAAQKALEARAPLVSLAMGGGARMQEGTPSMHRNIPKVQHSLNELEEAGVPHISIIADPTLGGTAISYGLRGDYMIVGAWRDDDNDVDSGSAYIFKRCPEGDFTEDCDVDFEDFCHFAGQWLQG